MMRAEKACLALSSLLGAGLVANGLYMLASPAAWYFAVPGVTTTGPFNQHFLRDIGLIFVLIGVAFLLGVVRPAVRVTLWGTSALARDFPAVTLPALIATALTFWAARHVTPAASASSYR